jgi:hypothetical protein
LHLPFFILQIACKPLIPAGMPFGIHVHMLRHSCGYRYANQGTVFCALEGVACIKIESSTINPNTTALMTFPRLYGVIIPFSENLQKILKPLISSAAKHSQDASGTLPEA